MLFLPRFLQITIPAKHLQILRNGLTVCVCFSSSAVCRKCFFNTLRAVAIATALNHNSTKFFKLARYMEFEVIVRSKPKQTLTNGFVMRLIKACGLLPLNSSRRLACNIVTDSVDILDLVYNSYACLFKHVIRDSCKVGGHKVACCNAS